jgi:hypothetical protein
VTSTLFRGSHWDEQVKLINYVYNDMDHHFRNMTLGGGGGSEIGCSVVQNSIVFIQPIFIVPMTIYRPCKIDI